MKCLISSITVLFSIYCFISCDDMYSIQQKYLDEGEEVYIGYPDIVGAYGGYERVQVEWKLNADPKIEECCIFWNNRQDSISVPPNRADSTMKHVISLPEGKYTLEMVNKSNKGYRSLTSTVSVESFGESYRESLYNRVIKNTQVTTDGLILTWSLEEGCVGIEMNYTDISGEMKNIFIESEQTQVILEDYLPGGSYTYTSLFLPEADAIDTIPAIEQTGTFPELSLQ